MKLLKFLAIGVFIVAFSFSTQAQADNIYKQNGFTKLFNGMDLSGWITPENDNGHWSVIDNVIDYDARSEAKGDKNLWSEKEYEDFQLHVEWRFKGYGDYLFPLMTILPNGDYVTNNEGKAIETLGPNADSGILLKGAGQVNMWCWSVGSGELWSVRNNQNLTEEMRTAAVPSSNQDQPVGFWNAFDITVKGEYITVINNGVTVIDQAYYPGLNITGSIGLQHHGGPDSKTGKMTGGSSLVQFRNIWIKEL